MDLRSSIEKTLLMVCTTPYPRRFNCLIVGRISNPVCLQSFKIQCEVLRSRWFLCLHVLLHRASGFGGLVVSMLASGTRVRGFKPGRSRHTNPQHAFLRKGSKAVGSMSQICGTLKNPCDYMEVGSKAKFVGHFSPELSYFANRGSALERLGAL
jgi:hypothetical protein